MATGLLAAPPALADVPGGATMTFPVNAATGVQPGQPFTWAASPGAQEYYLYVGTSPGAKNLVDSGELTATSYQVPQLPTGQTLWARIWTESATAWTYEDVSFTATALSSSVLSFPQDGAQAVDTATPFSWYAVPAATYYLDVGTSQGADDIVDSGELTSTSYQVPALPTGKTLWARLWTHVNGTWTYQDVSFSAAAPSHATFTSVQNGATTVDTSQPLTWSSVPSAQAYYLYVGTSQGSDDLVNSGAISATSYDLPSLPVGRTLWARVWTEVDGSWKYYSDVSFQVSISAARLTSPRPGTTNFDSRQLMTWSAAPNAEGYYLWVGTQPGTHDLVDSGSLSGSTLSFQPPALPIGQTVYARLFTEIDGSFNTYTDVSFTTAYSAAALTYPNAANAGPNQDVSRPFTWGPVPGASGYEVWIGTSPGSSDVRDSGLLSQPSYATGALPVGERLWARVWTLADGVWVYSPDVPFSAAAMITAPSQQATAVDPNQPIGWAPGAVLDGKQPTYELMLGTTPGGSDLLDRSSLSTTSLRVPPSALPAGGPIYARVIYHLGDGTERRTDTAFAVAGSDVRPAQMSWGPDGADAVDTSLPFTWTSTDLAQAYRLRILDGNGSAVADSGVIHVPEYFDEALPTGSYTAELGTELAGAWQTTTSTFTVTHSGRSASTEIDAAHWATNYVRHMADVDDFAYAWTELFASDNATDAPIYTLCGNYSIELLDILREMNVAGSLPSSEQPQRLEVSFISNDYDDHVLVNFWDSDDSDWIVLDPTVDIAMKRASDGHWATATDASAATRRQDWSAIQYVPLGDFGFRLAQAYYLDYPLLFLNAPATAVGTGADPTPYLTLQSAPPSGKQGVYLLQAEQAQTPVTVDGQAETQDTGFVDGYGIVFGAATLALTPGQSTGVKIYTPNRYVFTADSAPSATATPQESG
ncbi:MAG: hypothetical protein JOZ07_15430 [Solirubrobacterales bacterium]|nr:hypothetical protein [Solirubrobacterales bacterium]